MAATASVRILIPRSRLVIYTPLNVKTEYDPKTKKFVTSSGEKARYQASFLIPNTEKDGIAEIQAAIKKVAAEKNPEVPFKDWGHKFRQGEKLIERDQKKNPDKSADRMAYYKDHWVLEAKSVHLPDLSKAVNGKAVEVPADVASREFYSGCWVRAEINFAASEISDGEDENGDAKYKRYITAYHNFIVKVGEGDRLGRKSRDDVFKGALGGISDKAVDTDDVEF